MANVAAVVLVLRSLTCGGHRTVALENLGRPSLAKIGSPIVPVDLGLHKATG